MAPTLRNIAVLLLGLICMTEPSFARISAPECIPTVKRAADPVEGVALRRAELLLTRFADSLGPSKAARLKAAIANPRRDTQNIEADPLKLTYGLGGLDPQVWPGTMTWLHESAHLISAMKGRFVIGALYLARRFFRRNSMPYAMISGCLDFFPWQMEWAYLQELSYSERNDLFRLLKERIDAPDFYELPESERNATYLALLMLTHASDSKADYVNWRFVMHYANGNGHE